MVLTIMIGVAGLGVVIWQHNERQKLQKKLEFLEAVEAIGDKFNSQLKLSQLAAHIIGTLKKEIDAEIGAIFLVDQEGESLELKVALGHNDQVIEKSYSPIGMQIANKCAYHGEGSNLKDERSDEQAILTLPIKDEQKLIGIIQFINTLKGDRFSQEDQLFIEAIVRKKVVMCIEKAKLYEQLRTTFVDSISTVASVIDAKDKYTIGHCKRVAEYALRLGRYVGLDDEALEDLEYAAILHDVGKIGISDVILNKTSSLTEEEYELVKQHPVLGAEILKQITTLKEEIVWGAKYHHERYDGGGYGEGLKGKEIPLYARIIAIADSYDAMVGDRVYHKGVAVEEALRRLIEGRGEQFDPGLTNLFVQMIRATERSLNKEEQKME